MKFGVADGERVLTDTDAFDTSPPKGETVAL